MKNCNIFLENVLRRKSKSSRVEVEKSENSRCLTILCWQQKKNESFFVFSLFERFEIFFFIGTHIRRRNEIISQIENRKTQFSSHLNAICDLLCTCLSPHTRNILFSSTFTCDVSKCVYVYSLNAIQCCCHNHIEKRFFFSW